MSAAFVSDEGVFVKSTIVFQKGNDWIVAKKRVNGVTISVPEMIRIAALMRREIAEKKHSSQVRRFTLKVKENPAIYEIFMKVCDDY